MNAVSFCFFFKQKTAYELRISDWSSDVCSSDLQSRGVGVRALVAAIPCCEGALSVGERHGVRRPAEADPVHRADPVPDGHRVFLVRRGRPPQSVQARLSKAMYDRKSTRLYSSH